MEQMRERVARARDALNNQKQCDEDGVMCVVSRQALHEVLEHYDTLSLMQPEIDRRVAEERAKLLERLRGNFDVWEKAVSENWGQGSETHNVARDAVFIIDMFAKEQQP